MKNLLVFLSSALKAFSKLYNLNKTLTIQGSYESQIECQISFYYNKNKFPQITIIIYYSCLVSTLNMDFYRSHHSIFGKNL